MSKSKERWHGWKITDIKGARTLHVGRLPGRVGVALYAEWPDKGELLPLAYFKNEESALFALQFIDQLARRVP